MSHYVALSLLFDMVDCDRVLALPWELTLIIEFFDFSLISFFCNEVRCVYFAMSCTMAGLIRLLSIPVCIGWPLGAYCILAKEHFIPLT